MNSHFLTFLLFINRFLKTYLSSNVSNHEFFSMIRIEESLHFIIMTIVLPWSQSMCRSNLDFSSALSHVLNYILSESWNITQSVTQMKTDSIFFSHHLGILFYTLMVSHNSRTFHLFFVLVYSTKNVQMFSDCLEQWSRVCLFSFFS